MKPVKKENICVRVAEIYRKYGLLCCLILLFVCSIFDPSGFMDTAACVLVVLVFYAPWVFVVHKIYKKESWKENIRTKAFIAVYPFMLLLISAILFIGSFVADDPSPIIKTNNARITLFFVALFGFLVCGLSALILVSGEEDENSSEENKKLERK